MTSLEHQKSVERSTTAKHEMESICDTVLRQKSMSIVSIAESDNDDDIKRESLSPITVTRKVETTPNIIEKYKEEQKKSSPSICCNKKLGFILNKFWLYRIGIRFGFNKPRIITVGQLIFWLLCVLNFCFCGYLSLNKFYFDTKNKIFITSTFSIHSGLLTGVFYFCVILLSLRYPFYWRWGLFMIGFDRQMIYHRYCAILAAICCILHIVDNYKVIFVYKAITGWICYGFSILLILFASTCFRRKHYNTLFMHSHWIFIACFVIFGWLHNAILIQYGTYVVVFDILLRILDSKIRSVQIMNISMLDYDRVIRIDFKKKFFKYRAGQYVFIRIKDIGSLEFHPFSISSYPSHGDIITIFIKTFKKNYGGNWVDKLSNYVKAHQDNKDWYKNISVQVEGPFGDLTLPKAIHEYNHVLFVGGGIGVTPIDSLFNQLIYDLTEGNIKNAKVHSIDYIFTTRSRSLITEFTARNKAWQVSGLQQDVDKKEEEEEEELPGYNRAISDNLSDVHIEDETYIDKGSIQRKIVHGQVQLSQSLQINTNQLTSHTNHHYGDSLAITRNDIEMGQNKKPNIKLRKIGFQSSDLDACDEDNSFDDNDNDLDVEMINMAVKSLDITMSTHITRVKDKTLQKYYKKAFPFINFNRPNIRGIIYNASAKTKSKNMCIIASGPHGMIKHCIKYANEVGMNVHFEVFDW